MQLYRRFERNHALDYALRCSEDLGKPLVVYEGLRIDYPWASRRLHRFVLEGMQANVARAAALGLNYWPFVEKEKGEGRGLLRALSERAALVVTDDFPCFIVPPQAEALAGKVQVPVFAVDSNSLVPLSLLGPAVAAAAHLRPRIHKAFAEAWPQRATARPRIPDVATKRMKPPFAAWSTEDVAGFVDALPLDASVPPVAQTPGGTKAARTRLRDFVRKRLRGYAEQRSEPRSPAEQHASGLSPYLHFGHISIEEVVETVLAATGKWTPQELRLHDRGKREGFFCDDADVNSFLDEALTWRDVGFQWHWSRRWDAASLETGGTAGLGPADAGGACRGSPAHPLQRRRAGERRDPRSALERGAARAGGDRCDPQLPAHAVGQEGARVVGLPRRGVSHAGEAQQQIRARRPRPNSYTGILWCFGLFDRPWPPERKIFGAVRYMSSENTARKFDLKPYYAYVERLPTIAEARSVRPPGGLRSSAAVRF